MKIKVQRTYRGDTYTIGKMYLDYEDGRGFEYFCDTLEDKVRIINGDCSTKIYGQTAIPEGTYPIEIVIWAKHNNYYPLLKNVRCFTGIFIHSGADENDSEGCILVGYNKVKGHLVDGMSTMERLRKILKDCQDLKEPINIMVI